MRRICSRKLDYLLNSEDLCKKFVERSFHEKELKKTINKVAKTEMNFTRSNPRKQKPTNDISQYMASQTQRYHAYFEK